MMTSRERVICAMQFKEFDRVPMEVERGTTRFMSDVAYPTYQYGDDLNSSRILEKGRYVDSWGCGWECAEDGVRGEVKSPALPDWNLLDAFQPPYHVLEKADFSTVDRQCASSDKFMIHMFGIEPFQRMQFLRGTENVFMDLAYGDARIIKLRDMVHDFYRREVELWTETDVDGIHIEDDWGTQRALLISPDLWREYFKPIYKDYCDLARSKNKFIVMHSDGCTMEIIPDLIEIGFHALNLQLDCMDIDKIAALHAGKIAFWGGFDRQYLLPFGTTEEVRAEVQRIGNTFFHYGRTGLIAQCFRDKDCRSDNIKAYYDEWSIF